MRLREIQVAIEEGHAKDVEHLIPIALKEGYSPGEILQNAMVPAMKCVGEQYEHATDSIPKVLLAARSMRKGLDILEPLLGENRDRDLGTVILGTVEGDLHDVGKNLVGTVFRCAGFHVIDLGVDVPAKQFLKALKEHPETKIICISSLLTTSTPEMRNVVKQLRARVSQSVKIMVGGGSVTQAFADEIGADAYTSNAMEAVETAKSFLS